MLDTPDNPKPSQPLQIPVEEGAKKDTFIQMKCACGKALSVLPELAGKRIRCPACRTVLTVLVQGVPPPAPLGSLHAKLEEKISALAKKLEEERANLNKLLQDKETEIQALQQELAQKETDYGTAKQDIEKELNSLKSALNENNTAWQKKQKKYEEQISKEWGAKTAQTTKAYQDQVARLEKQSDQKDAEILAAQVEVLRMTTDWETKTAESEKAYQDQQLGNLAMIARLEEQSGQKDAEIQAAQAEALKITDEWKAKTAQLEKDYQEQMQTLADSQTQLVEEELANLEKKLDEERLIWRKKMD